MEEKRDEIGWLLVEVLNWTLVDWLKREFTWLELSCVRCRLFFAATELNWPRIIICQSCCYWLYNYIEHNIHTHLCNFLLYFWKFMCAAEKKPWLMQNTLWMVMPVSLANFSYLNIHKLYTTLSNNNFSDYFFICS